MELFSFSRQNKDIKHKLHKLTIYFFWIIFSIFQILLHKKSSKQKNRLSCVIFTQIVLQFKTTTVYLWRNFNTT